MNPLLTFQPRFFRRHSGGFTLVEVVMALGIFAFAVIPVIGLMNLGLTVSKDSIDATTMAQIFRQAEAQIVSTGTAVTTGTTYYFSNLGAMTSGTADSDNIYQAVITTETLPMDAAQGLLARKMLVVTVQRTAGSGAVLSKRVMEMTQNPAQIFQ